MEMMLHRSSSRTVSHEAQQRIHVCDARSILAKSSLKLCEAFRAHVAQSLRSILLPTAPAASSVQIWRQCRCHLAELN